MIHETTIAQLKEYFELRAAISVKRTQLDVYRAQIEKCAPNKKGTFQARINECERDIEKNKKMKQKIERVLDEIRRDVEDGQFNVYYLHYVKGMSLSKTAKRTGYSKSSICKILQKINVKVGTESGQGQP